MNGEKSKFASAGIWGGAIAVVASALQLYGLSASDAAEAAKHATAIYDGAMAIAGAAGGIVAIWGRWRATKTLY